MSKHHVKGCYPSHAINKIQSDTAGRFVIVNQFSHSSRNGLSVFPPRQSLSQAELLILTVLPNFAIEEPFFGILLELLDWQKGRFLEDRYVCCRKDRCI
jgi:hypothetical protein